MDMQELREVIACFDTSRTLLNYYPDRYAVYLLQKHMEGVDRLSVKDIRSTPLAKLLNKPIIKRLISGDGYLYRSALDYYWNDHSEDLIITLGEWGGKDKACWYQTSRKGANLVLQFNLNRKWESLFVRAIQNSANHFFDFGHPLSDRRSCTLGWTRLDLDLDSGEVLIEEIQTDLVREFNDLYDQALKAKVNGEECFRYWGVDFQTERLIGELNQFNSLFKDHWSEAMLWGTIWFCKDELGIDDIYYHEFETGALLKGLSYRKPPRSLYTQLPKKFCFRPTREGPSFLMDHKQVKRKLKKAKNEVSWFKLAA